MPGDKSLFNKLEDVLLSGGRDFDYVCFDEAFLVLQYMRNCYKEAQKVQTDSFMLPDDFAPINDLRSLFLKSFPLDERYSWSPEKEHMKYSKIQKVYTALRTVINRDPSSISDKLIILGNLDSGLRTTCSHKRGMRERVIDTKDGFAEQY